MGTAVNVGPGDTRPEMWGLVPTLHSETDLPSVPGRAEPPAF